MFVQELTRTKSVSRETQDIDGRRAVVRKHVGPRVPGDRAAAVGRGATREATGGGGGRHVADDGESDGASGRNDRRLEDKPVVCDGSCLLYTSPSPRDRQKSRMPSSA